MLPAIINQARKQAVAFYNNSFEFEVRFLDEYKEGMRDMKTSFTLANLSLTRLDWSFMPEISRETQVGDGEVVRNNKEGEVVEDVRVAKENVIVVEELEVVAESRVTEQADTLMDLPSEQ